MLAFITNICITRLLGVEGKGIFTFINANIGLLSMLLSFNIVKVLTYFVSKDKGKAKDYLAFGLVLNLGAFLMFSAACYLLLVTYSDGLNLFLPKNNISFFFLLFLLVSLGQKIINGFFTGAWQGSKKFLILNLVTIIEQVVKVVTFSSLYLLVRIKSWALDTETIFSVLIGVLLIDILIKALFFLREFEGISFRKEKLKSVSSSVLAFGTVGLGASLLNFGNRRIDVWFVEHFNGLEQLGYYGLAAGLVDILIRILIPAIQVISPYLTNSTPENRMKILKKVSRYNTAISFLGTLALALSSIWLIPFLYGKDFIPSILPLQILAIGVFFLMIRNVFATYNVAVNRQKNNLYGNGVSFFCTIVLNIILIPKYGVVGAAITSVVAYFASCVFIVGTVLKDLDSSVKGFFLVNKNDLKHLYLKGKVMVLKKNK